MHQNKVVFTLSYDCGNRCKIVDSTSCEED
jgi:hypothetical protein